MTKAKNRKKATNSPNDSASNRAVESKKTANARNKSMIFVGVGLLLAAALGAGLFVYFSNSSSTTFDGEQAYTVDEKVLFEEELSQQINSGDIAGAEASVNEKLQSAESNSEKVSLTIKLANVYSNDDVDKAIVTLNQANELATNAQDEYLVDGAFAVLYAGQEDWVNVYKYTEKSLLYLQSLSPTEIGGDAYEIPILEEELVWLEGQINE